MDILDIIYINSNLLSKNRNKYNIKLKYIKTYILYKYKK